MLKKYRKKLLCITTSILLLVQGWLLALSAPLPAVDEERVWKDFVFTLDEADVPFRMWIKGETLIAGEDGGGYGENIEITTCPDEAAPYSIRAREFIYHPERKFVLKDVTFWEKDTVIYRTPVLILPLHGEIPPLFPEIGHSAEEGWYVKHRRYFDIDRDAYGEVFGDYMSRAGLGLGVRHNYLSDNGVLKSIMLYHIQPLAGSKERSNFAYSHSGQSFQHTLLFDHTQERGSEDVVKGEWAYTAWKEAYYTNNVISLEQRGQEKKVDSTFQFFGYLSNELSLEAWFTQSNVFVPGGSAQLARDLSGKLSYQGKNGVIALLTQQHMTGLDVDGQLLWQGAILGPWIIEAGSGLLHEDGSGLRTTQTFLQGDYQTRQMPIGTHSMFSYGGSLRQEYYGTGDMQHTIQINLALETAYSSRMSSTVRWDVRTIAGHTPFLLLEEIPMNNFSLQMDYKWDESLRAELRWGYNFLLAMPEHVVVAAALTKNDGYWYIEGRYNPQENQLQGISLTHTIHRDDITGVISAEYDPSSKQFAQLAFDGKVEVTKGWSIEGGASLTYGQFDRESSRLALVRDLGCRELRLNYQPAEEKIWFEYNLVGRG